METLVFLADALAMVLLVLASLRAEKAKPGETFGGLFAYTVETEPDPRRSALPPAPYLQHQPAPEPELGGVKQRRSRRGTGRG